MARDGYWAILGRPAGCIREVLWFEASPRRSAARSFLLLLRDAVARAPGANWFAFCHQNDISLPGKLQAALACLSENQLPDRPILYGGRTLSVDEAGREEGLARSVRSHSLGSQCVGAEHRER
jgi:hypothetical protein